MSDVHVPAQPKRTLGGWLLISVPYIWLLIFFWRRS